MRREGIVIMVIGITLLTLVMNINHLFNAFTLFLLVGGIPGTSFSLPDLFMLVVSIVALLVLILWPFRDRLPIEKLAKFDKNQLDRLAKRRRYRQPTA